MKNKFFNKFKNGIKDVDDRELGHAVKTLATALRCPGGNLAAHATLASQMLTLCCFEARSIGFEQVITGNDGSRFKVKVERITQ